MNTLFPVLPNHYTSEDFYDVVKQRMKTLSPSTSPLVLVALDFDNFNYINDLFGYETGDQALQRITQHFSASLRDGEIFSRLHADHFAFCLQADDPVNLHARLLTITKFKALLHSLLPPHYSLIASGGVITITNDDLPLSSLMDRANYARKKAKGHAACSFVFHDQKLQEEVSWQKTVTSLMEAALKNHEFEMYLQPKVLIKNEQVVGAEALVRWNSPIHGMIYPDEFIPIMEQNGFVCQLDFFMLEEACLFLQQSSANGLPVLPISVNFSKAHLYADNLVERIFQTVNRLGISTNLIEIEFTESVFSADFEKMIEIMSDLKLLGFYVALDDFGSAYSSLRYLKELPVDIVKIDKGFLWDSKDSDKGRFILAKTVELIKSLRMLSVMEGVEEQDQVEFLQRLSCDVGQGYFYAKPMPAPQYKQYLQNNPPHPAIDALLAPGASPDDASSAYPIPAEFQMDNWELYTLGKNIDMGLIKGYLDGQATVQYINDRALEYLGYTRQELREDFHNHISAFIYPADLDLIRKTNQQLLQTGVPLTFQTRVIRKDKKIVVLKGRASCVIDSCSRPVGLYAFQDVTEELAQSAALQKSYQNYIEMLENLNGFVYVVDIHTHEVLYLNQATRNLGLQIAGPCYQIAFGYDAPCTACPIHQFSSTVHSGTAEIYSLVLKGWINSAASKIKWQGTRDAVLVCCTDISKYKQEPPEGLF